MEPDRHDDASLRAGAVVSVDAPPGRVALSECTARAPYCGCTDGTAECATHGWGRTGPAVCEAPRRMATTTRSTLRAGAQPAPQEGGTSRPSSAHDAAAYRAAGQRCWACNAPDSEPVRLQRRVGTRWVSETTLQLCTACLTALRTPRLVRQLGLRGARTVVPASPVLAEATPVERAVPPPTRPTSRRPSRCSRAPDARWRAGGVGRPCSGRPARAGEAC